MLSNVVLLKHNTA